MKYKDFEHIVSSERISKYRYACHGRNRKAMTLYRQNQQLSKELFGVINNFEIALRNGIDREMKARWGNDWLRDSIMPGGMFYNASNAMRTCKIIKKAYDKLMKKGNYSHAKLLSDMDLGFWKFMFSNALYGLAGRILLKMFPLKPSSTPSLKLNNAYVFNKLDSINNIRNRIAHHEPICFDANGNVDLSYVQERYTLMLILLHWMNIDSKSFLYGLDHVQKSCQKLMALTK